MKSVILFDIDGVLADFVGGALSLHGRNDIPHRDVVWGIEAQLGLDVATFWQKCGFDFWAKLDPLHDGFELLAHAERLVGAENIGLLTSPCDTAGCVEGKRDWVAKHLPAYRRRTFVGSAKELFAGPTKVLVDDHDANCGKFRDAGGWTIQPPRPWNTLKTLCVEGHEFRVKPLADALGSVVEMIRSKSEVPV